MKRSVETATPPVVCTGRLACAERLLVCSLDADTALEYFFLLDEIGQPLLSSSSESSSDESDMFVVIDSDVVTTV